MTLRDTLTLSPYQKWKRFGQLPTKLMCGAPANHTWPRKIARLTPRVFDPTSQIARARRGALRFPADYRLRRGG